MSKFTMADIARLTYNITAEKAKILEGIDSIRWGKIDEQLKHALIQATADQVENVIKTTETTAPDYVVDNWTKIIDLAKYGIFI